MGDNERLFAFESDSQLKILLPPARPELTLDQHVVQSTFQNTLISF